MLISFTLISFIFFILPDNFDFLTDALIKDENNG